MASCCLLLTTDDNILTSPESPSSAGPGHSTVQFQQSPLPDPALPPIFFQSASLIIPCFIFSWPCLRYASLAFNNKHCWPTIQHPHMSTQPYDPGLLSSCFFSHLEGGIMPVISRFRKAAILHMSKLNQTATLLQTDEQQSQRSNTKAKNLISFLAVNMINFVTHNTYVPFHS
ncbi:hypothetical protein KP509_35G015300 [Ceratopteris richardii]|uniref:Uncharacterized protein n=1 Tax=Ceratopteris richardii TaxID=49495 RepID=A0A8T2QEZ4_CERRI|nr:hypothetical protein KP509_35G015300 [Ceratopteris richardii]